LPVAQYDFNQLRDDLTEESRGDAFKVVEACLKFATSETRRLKFATSGTRRGYRFDSAAWRRLAKMENLFGLIPVPLLTGLHPGNLQAIATAIDISCNQPLAAWGIAQMISTAISKNFAAYEPPYGPEYTLEDLRGFTVPAESAKNLYGKKTALSMEPGPDRNQYDPSAVSGLRLWLDEPLLHGSFKVIVDKGCGAQFDAAIGYDEKLKIALIQPNKSLLELSVTKVSPESDGDPRFFGVGPRCAKAQTKKVLKGLELAAAAGAGVALLPELVMTEALVKTVAAELGSRGNIITHGARRHTLRMVVSGSYHHVEHVDGEEVQRNSTQVHFPWANLQRQHSKSGKFVYPAPQVVMEAWKHSRWIFHWPAVFELIKHGLRKKPKHGSPEDIIRFREDVEPTTEIRLFAGAKFSVVVVICADLLNKTFRRVLETLQPSLVLVCNMTPKQGDFTSAAHALILACQSTLVAVNNPAKWSKPGEIFGTPVAGGMAGLPVRDGNKRVIEARVPSNKILIFDPKERQLQVYPR
jgi:hypothetical protein